jgi:hypothetical protein|tara:strand:- start:210 stop:374 length:165 start_codon:yes stop_codon:yes gene_type:complete
MNQIHVYDLQFFKTDESGNSIVNADGSTKVFYAPYVDLPISTDGLKEVDLVECE